MARMEILSARRWGAGRHVTQPLKLPDCTVLEVRIARPVWGVGLPTERGQRAEVIEFSDGDDGFLAQGLESEVLRVGLMGLVDGKWIALGHVGTQAGDKFTRLGDRLEETTLMLALRERVPSEIKLIVQCLDAVETKIEVEPVSRVLRAVKLRDEHHSIAVEDVQTGTATSGNSSVSTASITPAGDDRYLAIIGGNGQYPTAAAYTSMAFGGTTATQRGTATGFYNRISAAALVAPSTTGAVCSYVVNSTEDRMGICAVAFSGVDQSTPHDDPVTSGANTNAPSVTVAAGEAGDVRIAGTFTQDTSGATFTAGANETSRASIEWGSNAALAVETKEDGGSDALDFTNDQTGWTATIGWNINMAEEGGGGSFQAAWARNSNVVIQ